MEKPPVNPVHKVETSKAKQSVEQFSFSQQEKNIQEVFKLSPELKEIVYQSLGIENEKDIVIELGQNKENELGKIQNINVYYKGEKIIDSDVQDSSKLYLVTKEDGTSYVGDIFLPTELQGQGLAKKILQKVSDTLDTKIMPTYLSTGGFTSENAKKMWEKIGNEILPNHEAEKLYAEYLKTVFPESKVQDIVWHGSKDALYIKNKGFQGRFFDKNVGAYQNGIYFTKNKNLASEFTKGRDENLDLSNSGILPVLVNIKSIYNSSKGYETALIDDRKLANFLEQGIDGIELLDKEFKIPKHEIVVFDPSQIHILGSKTDIEKFKNFIKKEKVKEDLKYEPLKYVLEIEGVENAQQLVDKLSAFETKAGFEKVFEKLKSTEILEKIKVRFNSIPGTTLARYSQARNTLEIDSTYGNIANIGDFYVTILHELFHHVFRGADISSGLNLVYGLTSIKNTIEKLPVHNKYRNLYSLVLHNVSKEIKNDHYGLSSVDEFISEAYSNPAFQNFLKTIELKNKKSVSSKAIDLLLSVATLNNRVSSHEISEKDAFSAFQKIDLESLNLLEDFEKNMKNYSHE